MRSRSGDWRLAASIVGLVLSACSLLDRGPALRGSPGEGSAISDSAERRPAALGDDRSPCRDSGDCRAPLACRSHWCRPASGRGEAYETCFSPDDCVSRRCGSDRRCLPSIEAPAANDERCLGAPTNCRSLNCGDDGFCKPSLRFPNWSPKSCLVGTDCIGGRCDRPRANIPGQCLPEGLTSATRAGRTNSCGEISATCFGPNDCCSGLCSDQGKCIGRMALECLQRGQCEGLAGRVCAAPETPVRQASECCTNQVSGGVCAPDFRLPVQVCSSPAHCRSGFRCDSRRRVCVPD